MVNILKEILKTHFSFELKLRSFKMLNRYSVHDQNVRVYFLSEFAVTYNRSLLVLIDDNFTEQQLHKKLKD